MVVVDFVTTIEWASAELQRLRSDYSQDSPVKLFNAHNSPYEN